MKNECIVCGKSFTTYPCWVKRSGGKYCSKRCRYLHQRGKNHPNYGIKLSDELKEKIKIAKRTGKFVKCLICGKDIYRRKNQLEKSDRFFCSRECSFKGKKPRKKMGKLVICCSCGKKVYRRPGEPEWKNSFCSRECKKGFSLVEKKKYKCILCGKEFSEYQSYIKARGSRKYCSVKCRAITKKGKGSSSWKSGSSYKKFLWRLFSKYTRQRDNGVCISCGKVGNWKDMDAGHYIPKTAGLALYFHEKNVNCQCTYCNRWMHGNLSAYAIALQRKYGKDILEELDSERNKISKITIPEYQKLIDHYKDKLKKNGWEI